MIDVKCERYWKWIAKKRPGVNTRSSLRLIKILKGWEKFSRSNKGVYVCM